MTATQLLRALQDAIYTSANTMSLWRDTAIVVLALVVIGCLVFTASVWGGE